MYYTIRQLSSEGQSGWMPPNEVARALNLASADKFNEEKRAFEATSFISDNLRKFKRTSDRPVSAGSATLPDDYGFRTSMSVTSSGKNVDIVPDSEWNSRINDPIAPPTSDRPIASIGPSITVVPASLPSVTLKYLKKPIVMVIDFTEDGNGDITINQGSSTDSDWPDECDTDLILRALVYLGVPLSNDLLVKLKSFKKQTEGV